MRIGIYKDTLANRRGADFAVLALAEGLRERRHEVAVFEKKEFERRIKEPWDVVISTGTNELLEIAAAWGHTALPVRRGQFPIPDSQFPIIQQFHTNPKSQFKWKRLVRNWKIRHALRHVSAIQVLSESFVPQVAKYGAPVFVIGNWSAYDGLAAKDAKKVVIYPAAFAKGKNQKLLIEAFLRVANEFPDWRLRLLGRTEGKYADECRRLAAKLSGAMGSSRPTGVAGVEGLIEFAGYSDDMASEYARCAFVAFPSLDEGFPLTIVDAAAFAKPCVMVEDWIGTAAAGGGIVTKPTVGAYADGLRRLMADTELRCRLGENARSFCAEHYSRERILDQWEALLREQELCT